jgi:energy-coupling factor transporter ATP-binding protein EcfA2
LPDKEDEQGGRSDKEDDEKSFNFSDYESDPPRPRSVCIVGANSSDEASPRSKPPGHSSSHSSDTSTGNSEGDITVVRAKTPAIPIPGSAGANAGASLSNRGAATPTPNAEQNGMPDVAPDAAPVEITVLIAGKSGAGKSTLINNILENNEKPIDPSPDPAPSEFKIHKRRSGNTTVRIIDTPGLGEDEKEKKKQLKMLSPYKADLLIYCITVAPGNRISATNPTIMKALQKAFGEGIWKNCVVVFTFSNYAWNAFCSSTDTEQQAIDKYKTYINTYAERFQEELKRLGKNTNKEVKSIFNLPHHPRQAGNVSIIPAVPAGFTGDDRVLADLEIDGHNLNWSDAVFLEMIEKCKDEHKIPFVGYRYGETKEKRVKMLLGGSGGGALTVAGALVGILVGIVGGPLGMVLGGAVGATTGLIIGTTAVATGGAVASIKH